MDYFDIYMEYFDIYMEYSAAEWEQEFWAFGGKKMASQRIFFSAKPSHSTHLHIWNPM